MTTPPTTMQDSPEYTFAQQLVDNARLWRHADEDWTTYTKRILMGDSPMGLLDDAAQCSISGTAGWVRKMARGADESDPR